ncbi:MAG: HAMP domain-containing histidine kinase [Ruminococcus sp.]|nr:HAMP domain-containing histidine kinase [Ruminococcus sp.]
MHWAITAILASAVLFLVFRLKVIHSDLRKISRELELNRQGDYNRRITVNTADKQLMKTAAELNRTLDYQQQLKNERERAERSLRESVSDIAHDLRTPLTVIRGDLQLLESEEQLPERCREYVDVCKEKADILKEIADSFFELSVLESDTDEVPLEKLNAVNEAAQFIADHESVITLNGLNPEILLPDKTLYMMADKRLLTRMLENLLNNVIKYSSGSFQFRVTEEENAVAICFSNPAPELTQADADNLFLRTYRADRSRSRTGAGLGLYIVRLLAAKQSASAEAEIKEGVLTICLRFIKA